MLPAISIASDWERGFGTWTSAYGRGHGSDFATSTCVSGLGYFGGVGIDSCSDFSATTANLIDCNLQISGNLS